MGAEPRLDRRHDERLHRGLHGRARHQGRVGRRRLLRQPREDREDPARWPTHAQWFEDHLPVEPRVSQAARCRASRRGRSRSSSRPATRARSRRSASTCRTISASARSYGSKSVSLSNVIEAYEQSTPDSFRQEFAWERRGGRAGQAVGRVCQRADDRDSRSARPRLGPHGRARRPCTPQELLKEQYSALEESRADLVALYFVADPYLADARPGAGRRAAGASSAPSTKPTRATRSCSCGACAKARSSKKITCATARRSCTG